VFYLASSLKINIKKSNVYGIGVSDVDVSSMASFSRSHTLIKAVLGSLRIYYFSIFKVPESVLKLFGKILPNVFLERLYRLEREKSCLIIECIDHGRWRWNWSRPNLSARNSANLLDMLFEISSTELNEVWDKNIPRKVVIFILRLILDRLPHKLNLSSRGIDIQAISCPSCNGNVESSIHIFFECTIAMDIWMLVRKWCDISFPPFTSYEHWKCWFTSWQVVKEKSRRLSFIFSSSLW
ncbi:RNA-directed DNA polymerase, eukaryota, partial [Tanacetum coccineum]